MIFLNTGLIPRLELGHWVTLGLEWLRTNGRAFFDAIATGLRFLIDGLSDALVGAPALVLVIVFALLGWFFRSWRLGVGTLLSFLLIMSMNQWEQAMQTLALVTVATVITLVLAIPLGILAAKNSVVSAVIKPILDFMQTMPAFVYLIPAVMFFSIGVVPGVISTIIFSFPPGVRFTELGIRQVDKETIEAGKAFGASNWQILYQIQWPLAIPTIIAGVNQVIMLALSMSVIAGMVGADGLGKDVVQAISTLNMPLGIEAGLSVVFLAIFLDRLTAALGNQHEHPSSLLNIIRTRCLAAKQRDDTDADAAEDQHAPEMQPERQEELHGVVADN